MPPKQLFPFHHFSRAQIASRKREGHLNVMVKEFESHKKIEIAEKDYLQTSRIHVFIYNKTFDVFDFCSQQQETLYINSF